MDTFPPELIILAVVVVSAAALGVWLFTYIQRGGKNKSPIRRPALASQPGTQDGDQELDPGDILTVARTKADKLTVFVGGQPYRSLKEITDPQLGLSAVEAIKAVMAFAEGYLPATAPQPVARRTEIPSAPPRANPPRQPAAATDKPVTITPGSMLDPLALAEEIDDLVQERLQQRPDLAEHNVHITTGLRGGVRVYVDQQIFEAVADVSDPEVRTLIQAAIRDWENR